MKKVIIEFKSKQSFELFKSTFPYLNWKDALSRSKPSITYEK